MLVKRAPRRRARNDQLVGEDDSISGWQTSIDDGSDSDEALLQLLANQSECVEDEHTSLPPIKADSKLPQLCRRTPVGSSSDATVLAPEEHSPAAGQITAVKSSKCSKSKQSALHRGIFRVREAGPAMMREQLPTATVTFTIESKGDEDTKQRGTSEGRAANTSGNESTSDPVNATPSTAPTIRRSKRSSLIESRSKRVFRLPTVVEAATGSDIAEELKGKIRKPRRRRHTTRPEQDVDECVDTRVDWRPPAIDAELQENLSSSKLQHQPPFQSLPNVSCWQASPSSPQVVPVLLCRNDRVFRPKPRFE
jgi:hypothetical protein